MRQFAGFDRHSGDDVVLFPASKVPEGEVTPGYCAPQTRHWHELGIFYFPLLGDNLSNLSSSEAPLRLEVVGYAGPSSSG